MSPLKIAIATFVVGVMGLTASAMNESGSFNGRIPHHIKYKPVMPCLEFEDVLKLESAKNFINTYKRCLTKMRSPNADRNQDGTVRRRKPEEPFLDFINEIEERAWNLKLTQLTGPARAQAELARAQAEQDASQAEQGAAQAEQAGSFNGRIPEHIKYKPVMPCLEFEDVLKSESATNIIHTYKRSLTNLKLLNNDPNQDGTVRRGRSKESLLNFINEIEERAWNLKLTQLTGPARAQAVLARAQPEHEAALAELCRIQAELEIAERKLARVLAGHDVAQPEQGAALAELARIQAELEIAQAKLARAGAKLARVLAGYDVAQAEQARARTQEARDGAQAEQQYGAQAEAERLNWEQAEQLDDEQAEAEELDLGKPERDRRIREIFGDDTP